MKTYRVIAGLFYFAVMGGAAAESWTKVSGPFFSVEMPGKPEKKDAQQEVKGMGMTKTISYESHLQGIAISLLRPRNFLER